MVENKDDPETKKGCPVSELVRHLLYVGGMVALHTGLGATATVAGKSHKCPVSEWARHAVYVGGFVALCAKAGMGMKTIEQEKKTDDKKEACPVDQWTKHAIYVAGMVGVVALINSRKK